MLRCPTVSTSLYLFYPFDLRFADTDYDFFTSTPFVRKPASKPPSKVGVKEAAKAAKASKPEPIKEEDESFENVYTEVKVGVIASGGMRSVTLFKTQTHVEVLTRSPRQ